MALQGKIKGTEFLYIHIYKNGGHTIRHLLDMHADIPNVEVCDIHTPAFELKRNFQHFEWLVKVKFAYVRNPWDRMISLYFYIRHQPEHPFYQKANALNFNQFVEYFCNEVMHKLNNPHYITQYEYLYEGSNCLVDFIGRAENFNEDTRKLFEGFGIDKIEIPCLNPTQHGTRQEYFNSQTQQLVSKTFEMDCDTFKYAF